VGKPFLVLTIFNFFAFRLLMRKFACSIILVLFALSLQAQRSQVGLIGGVTYYIGDLNPNKQFFLVKPAGGVFYRYNLNPRMSVRGNIIYGGIEGDDSKSKDTFALNRNLSFKSMLLEFSGYFEFNFFNYVLGDPSYPFTPYVFAGASIFRFNPKADLNGNDFALQPLGTEGQGTTAYPDRKKYSLVNPSVLFGVGLKWNVFRGFGMGLEWGMRRTFTDYLDDVSKTYADVVAVSAENGPDAGALSDRSVDPGTNTDRQRGNSKTNDWFSFAGLSLTFNIKGKQSQCPAYPNH
jgi:hypothetical protein